MTRTVTIFGKPVNLDHVAEVTGLFERDGRYRIGSRGQRYAVHYNGETIVESSAIPEYDACRALQARGVKGMVGFGRGTQIGIVVDIDVGAGLTVVENHGYPRVAKWQPFEPGSIFSHRPEPQPAS